MEKVYDKCCGIDVHKKILVCCFLCGKKKEIKEFDTTTSELLKLTDWLTEGGCEIVAMESTASYWKPVYNILEVSGLKAIVVNAQHMRNVPGRKTDVKDAEWIADLLKHGLLTPSFIPSREQREFRELMTYRKSLVQERNRHTNRLLKILEGGNIKLSSVVSDINSMSARNLLKDLIAGIDINIDHVNQMKIDKRITRQLRTEPTMLVEACKGRLSSTQKRLLKQVVDHLDNINKSINDLDELIDDHMSEKEHQAVEAISEVTGLGTDSARAVISVTGTDMNRFPTDSAFSAWAGLCPGNNESAKKNEVPGQGKVTGC